MDSLIGKILKCEKVSHIKKYFWLFRFNKTDDESLIHWISIKKALHSFTLISCHLICRKDLRARESDLKTFPFHQKLHRVNIIWKEGNVQRDFHLSKSSLFGVRGRKWDEWGDIYTHTQTHNDFYAVWCVEGVNQTEMRVRKNIFLKPSGLCLGQKVPFDWKKKVSW